MSKVLIVTTKIFEIIVVLQTFNNNQHRWASYCPSANWKHKLISKPTLLLILYAEGEGAKYHRPFLVTSGNCNQSPDTQAARNKGVSISQRHLQLYHIIFSCLFSLSTKPVIVSITSMIVGLLVCPSQFCSQ